LSSNQTPVALSISIPTLETVIFHVGYKRNHLTTGMFHSLLRLPAAHLRIKVLSGGYDADSDAEINVPTKADNSTSNGDLIAETGLSMEEDEIITRARAMNAIANNQAVETVGIKLCHIQSSRDVLCLLCTIAMLPCITDLLFGDYESEHLSQADMIYFNDIRDGLKLPFCKVYSSDDHFDM